MLRERFGRKEPIWDRSSALLAHIVVPQHSVHKRATLTRILQSALIDPDAKVLKTGT
jgi:hypothetical protein